MPKSTEELNAADVVDNPNDVGFFGAYGNLRKSLLDYSYHAHYRKERQWLHDAIIFDTMLQHDRRCDDAAGTTNSSSSDDDEKDTLQQLQQQPTTGIWLVLVVGVHGVGKHHVIQNLIASDRLRLLSVVCIDTGTYVRMVCTWDRIG
jgi:hypothetical protein